jgi:hypothetical protein
MNTKPKPAALNHALLSRQAIDSSALAVRGVLMHRFALPGRYEVYASRAGRVVHRELIEVAQDDGATQLDVRLGLPEDEGRCNCGGRSPQGGRLQTGGVMSFYATKGAAHYQVRIERWHDKGREVELDSEKGLPAGDLFAAALVMPGCYRVRLGRKTLAEVVVRQPDAKPDPKKPHRTDQPVLLKTGQPPKAPLELNAGTCLVIWLDEPGTVRVEPLELLGENVKAA